MRDGGRGLVPTLLVTILVVTGVALLAGGAANWERIIDRPVERVVVTLDVSNSMDARDIEPSRLDALLDAAPALMYALPAGVPVAAGVPISTIAVGTADGTILLDGEQSAVPVNTTALRTFASRTGGTFRHARTAGDLTLAMRALADDVESSSRSREVRAGAVVALAAAFVLIVAATAMAWRRTLR